MTNPKIPVFFYLWFAFCAIGSIGVIGFVLYLAWRLVEHFTK